VKIAKSKSIEKDKSTILESIITLLEDHFMADQGSNISPCMPSCIKFDIDSVLQLAASFLRVSLDLIYKLSFTPQLLSLQRRISEFCPSLIRKLNGRGIEDIKSGKVAQLLPSIGVALEKMICPFVQQNVVDVLVEYALYHYPHRAT
jgi:hypothetical protein